ncbi:MAG: leucine--tRNA ligase [Candidatus Nealsonbacteria bacterium]|nr:leucine--tRNA ligase [Candidatus Nealsonbacteria bacterium]
MEQYSPQKIEKKWRLFWEKRKVFYVDLEKAKSPYYNLMMFPYPSAEGLHVGNVYAFTGSDIHGRFQRMRGNDVFEPMGFDAFGIHSENFAIKKGIHPKVLIKKNTDHFQEQLKSLGCLFDWRHAVDTTKPEYYKWTQWLFLQLFKAGLAYRAKAPVDWCPSCKTVLADEQVIQGRCERCDSEVIQKETEQWFFRITEYADRLLKNLDWIDWSERTRIAQRNWIGKSEGAELEFKIKNDGEAIKVFTTRPDTLFGATYLVLAPEYPLVKNWKLKIDNWNEVERYIEEARKKTELERTELIKEKTGVELRGIRAINPANQEEIPVFLADYVLASYGTGAIMAVPAHDQRDFDFAKKYNLPIKMVICPNYPNPVCPVLDKAFTGQGYLVGSGRFDGMPVEKAKWEITVFVGGKKTVHFHVRDWLISRQRYWGPPIPIIYCPKCGVVPVPEKDLPVLLPFAKDFRPEGTGKSPLANISKFVKTKCPKCKGVAKRETDVSDTFLDSAWYFLRYPSTGSKDKPFDEKLTKKWLPVKMYIGGQEHAVLHLLYSRFITMVLKDLGLIDFEEPFEKFRAHGLLTKEGAKMSKSKGNVVNPDEYYRQYGADTLRAYLMFSGPFQEGGDWQDRGIVGVKRFLEKVWGLQEKISKTPVQGAERLVQKTVKKVTEDLENLGYNTAIPALMIFANELAQTTSISRADYEILLKLLAPFAPYISEELWSKIGNKDSIHNQKWPEYQEKLIQEEKTTIIIQVNGRVRDKVEVKIGLSEEEVKELTISRENVKKWITGKEIKKIVFVPDKLINIVIAS